jgi:Ni,Fe-hydrogenase maturation factor
MEASSTPKSATNGPGPLVIAYGSLLRQDDAMAWRAAELLPGEVIREHQLTPELVTHLQKASLVIFIDAAVDLSPGSIRLKALHPAKLQPWSHHILPEQLLTLAEQVNGKAPPAFLISGGVQDTGLSEQMTETGKKCAATMADLARRLMYGKRPFCPGSPIDDLTNVVINDNIGG